MLERGGFEVVGEAADGAEALAAAEQHAPDVALIDLVMPNVDGIEAIRGLRERVPAARAIVISSRRVRSICWPCVAIQFRAVRCYRRRFKPSCWPPRRPPSARCCPA